MYDEPLSLFICSCDIVISCLENINTDTSYYQGCNLLSKLGARITELLLDRAVRRELNKTIEWKDGWKIFFTQNIRYAAIPWEKNVLQLASSSKNLQLIQVISCKEFDVQLLNILPETIHTLIFSYECNIMVENTEHRNWLPEAEEILKSLCSPSKNLSCAQSVSHLQEVDLETISATASDLQVILKKSPTLRYLRHYQMVKALYDTHVEVWKNKETLPSYKLRNLDIDFSHVIRCRMSPDWVLAPEALQLVTILCPQAEEINLRFDCSTPNDVLSPLLTLGKIRKFSAVCVTSGERTNLDFSDMAPIFEKYGPLTLNYLELKVIEEVEVHCIIQHCIRLESLILSGCGYVTPPTCPSYNCHSYRNGTFNKLRHLFFADGDDFSWDHGAPECFWKATLLPSVPAKTAPLEGIFLEFPRIPDYLTSEIFRRTSTNLEEIPFPMLQVASFCRYAELNREDIVSLCGLEKKTNPPITFLRISDCDQWESTEEKAFRNWFKQRQIKIKVIIDGSNENAQEQRRPYSYRIKR